jgi:putative spermidine/putrescine transport system permease protein
VQDWPFSAALSLIFTLAVTGIVLALGVLSRRLVRGVDAA